MRNLTSEHRLQSFSVPEITEAFERSVLDLARSLKFEGRKLKPGPALNALALHFLDMGEAERERVLRTYLRKLETILESDPPSRSAPRGLIARRDETEADERRAKAKAPPKRKG